MSNSVFMHGNWLQLTIAQMRRRLDETASTIKLARAKREKYLRTLNELQSLTDRDLADIGIPRARINQIAWDEATKGAGNGLS